MKRLLKKLPHRHRDTSSEQRPSSQPKLIGSTSPRTPTVYYDAEKDSNRRPKTAKPTDDPPSKQTSTFNAPKKRESTLVSYNQHVDTSSTNRSDTSRSNTRKSDHGLHLNIQDTSLYDDLSYLTLGGDSRDAVEPSRKRYSEDVADRNLMFNEKGPLSERNSSRRRSISLRAPAQVDEFSEDIADRNIEPGSSPEARPSTSEVDLYPLETQEQANQRIATQPFFSDEFYEPRFDECRGSSNSLNPLLLDDKRNKN
jgi:hypothetical protein